MKKKTRHQMYVHPKTKVMKMHEDTDDMDDMMDDMCDMEDIDDIDDMEDEMEECGMEDEHHHMYGKKMHGMNMMCGQVPECTMLAHAYVPWQCYEKAFTPPEALMKGTLFPELWGVYRIPK